MKNENIWLTFYFPSSLLDDFSECRVLVVSKSVNGLEKNEYYKLNLSWPLCKIFTDKVTNYKVMWK